MKCRYGYVAVAAAVAALSGLTFSTAVKAQEQDKEQTQLATALQGVSVSLERGLSAASRSGKPISGKFEVEGGTVQLSVYTMKGAEFSEVIVDHKTGRISKTEKIASGDDLKAAQEQSAAMAKAKRTLRSAVEHAIKANAGFKAVSVVAALDGETPTATIKLVQGTTFKTISEKLN